MENNIDYDALFNEFQGSKQAPTQTPQPASGQDQSSSFDPDALLQEYRASKRGAVSTPSTAQQSKGQPVIGSLGQVIPQVSDESENIKNLGFVENLALGFSASPRASMEWLADRYKGSNVSQTDTGEITIDGMRINKPGFDFGDVLRNLGFALPIAGQIAGGTAGATAGSVVPFAGTTAGAISGGAAGGMTGEAARLGIGALFGIDPTLAEASGSLAKEGILSAGGEVLTRGVGAGAKALSRTQIANKFGKFWHDTTKDLGKETTAKIAKFVGSIDNDAVEISKNTKGVANINGKQVNVDSFANLNEEYFRQDKAIDIAKNTFLGQQGKNVTSLGIGTDLPGIEGVQTGTKMIMESIENLNDSSFEKLVRTYAPDLPQETIDLIKSEGTSRVLNASNLSPQKPGAIARQLLESAQSKLDDLGKQLRVAENKATSGAEGKLPFDVSEIGMNFENALKNSGLLGSNKIATGFKKSAPINVAGSKEANSILDLFKQELSNKKLVEIFGDDAPKMAGKKFFYGQTISHNGRTHVLPGPTQSTAKTLRIKLDQLVDQVFKKDTPAEVKRIVYDVAKSYRSRYYELTGLGELSQKYSAFKDVLHNARIDGESVTAEIFNRINKLPSQNALMQQNIDAVLSELPNGSVLKKEMALYSAGQSLKTNRFDAQGIIKQFEGDISKNSILRSDKMTFGESVLKDVDDLFKSNPKLQGRLFLDEAKKSLAAKKFVENSGNLLRIGAVRNLLGMGALGSMFGPVGVAASGVAALTLSDPKVIAKLLVKQAERRSAKALAKQAVAQTTAGSSGSNIARNLAPASATSLLNQLINNNRSNNDSE